MRATAQVGIIGAGPAGARAAELLARRGVSVVLLDPKAPWEKPCGGGLTPPLFEEIPELEELAPEARAVERVRIEVAPDEGFSVELERPIRIISRKTLAAWQLERALAAGAVHLPAKVRSITHFEGGWSLDTDHGDFRVPFMVGADGAASLVRRVAVPRFSVELAPTRVAYPPECRAIGDVMVLKFYEGLAGYLWDFPRPDHRSVGSGVPNGTWARPLLDAEIDGYRDSSHPDCIDPDRAGAVIGTAQLGHGDFSQIAGENFALLGDAAGFADPLTGEGIQNALRSAGLLAAAWDEGHVGRLYPILAQRAFSREFAVARLLRRTMLESGTGLRLIRSARTSNVAYAVVAAALNGLNEHDGHPARLLRRWYGTFRKVRKDPSLARRTTRAPVPCEHRSADTVAASTHSYPSTHHAA
ncbi:MAG: NAD(P)/FAD-dependent oxidoreductase [Gemmatimonadales bacterium]